MTPLWNCSCTVVSSFLGVHLPLGWSRKKQQSGRGHYLIPKAQQVRPTVKCMLIMFLWHVWKCASLIPSSGRNHKPTFLCRCTTPTAKCAAKMTWELAHWRWVAPPWQCCCSFCSVCANFPANKATTVAPHSSGSHVSLHLFYFLKLNLVVKGRFHDSSMIKNSCKPYLQSSEHRSWQKLPTVTQELGLLHQGWEIPCRQHHRAWRNVDISVVKKKNCLRLYNHPSEFLTQIVNGSHN